MKEDRGRNLRLTRKNDEDVRITSSSIHITGFRADAIRGVAYHRSIVLRTDWNVFEVFCLARDPIVQSEEERFLRFFFASFADHLHVFHVPFLSRALRFLHHRQTQFHRFTDVVQLALKIGDQ